ncbi:MAG TPA: flagellar hook-basal body protein [Solirubrobacterales bacterium]|jgi:flagellar basal-body rod protein FlgG|nr:flagellar hook-basal body protein [Solirubrobacterales bacterium]
MDSGLYIAASGMLTEMVRQEQISNDLANVNTPGFKSDGTVQTSFGELLLHNTSTGAQIGSLSLGAEISETPTNLTPDPLHETGEPLDFGIEGEGFFGVRTAAGVRYTRNGQFTADAEGNLTDAQGDAVLGPNGAPVKLRADGTVPVTDVGVFEVAGVRQEGENLFTGNATGAASGQARAGFLEESGVNPARVMTQMISSFRSLEADQKSIQTIDETLDESAGSVGSIS